MKFEPLLKELMKYSLLGIFLQCMFLNMILASTTEAQRYQSVKEIYMTIKLKDASLKETFNWINDNTDLNFNYDNIHIDDLKTKINFQKNNASIEDLLLHISKKAKLKFKQVNDNISVDFMDQKNNEKEIEIVLQGIRITGRVIADDEPEGMPGVNILLQGSMTGTVTDLNGNYAIEVPDENAVLIYSSVGYITQEIAVGSQTVINLEMASDVTALKEIVVIGYGVQKKEDATGSLVKVDSEDFNKGAIASPQELLMGKVAGVVVSAPNGQPGGASTIRIRGGSSLRASNDPLIIIDGVPVDNNEVSGLSNPLSTINPNDIETFTVLKDASATAIYGSRASNGVIIITTKTGKKGQDTRISYNGNVSVGVPIEYVDVYSGDEYREVVTTNEDIPAVAQDLLGDEDTDWQKEIFRTAISTDHNLSITGTINDNLPYRASVGYINQNGILKETKMERTTLGIALDPAFFDDHLRLKVNLKGMNINNNFSNTGAIGNSILFDPTKPVRDENSPYGGYYAWTTSDGTPNFIANNNPVALIEQTENTSEILRSIGNAEVTYKFHFLPELKAHANFGYDYYRSKGIDHTDSTAAFAYRSRQTNVKSYEYIGQNELFDFYLNYTKNIDPINSTLDITAGYSWQHFYSEKENANRPWNMTDGVYVGADTVVNKTENYLVSFFGRINYTFMGRYLLTATLRQDGSSRFAEDNRWGFFPAVALAWQINEEAFLRNVDALNELKLRIGYGITGQQELSDGDWPLDYPAIASYNGSTSNAYYRFGNELYQLWKPEAYDPNIKWEETATKNIGLDFSFLDNRIGGSIDYYQRTTDDLLNEIPIPAGTNFANRVVTNVGSLENEGYEVALHGYPVSTEDMSLFIGVNFARNENRITKLTAFADPNYIGYEVGEIDGGSNNRVQINSVGYPTNTFFLFKQVYDADGNPIEGLYIDKTGEGGSVTGNDLNRYHLQTPAPDFNLGLSSRFDYKNFDMSFAGRLSVGNYVFNNVNAEKAVYAMLYNQSGYLSNIVKTVEESQFFNAQYKSDYYLENGSFFRMDYITAGYTFNRFFSEKINGRLSFTVQNAFLITNYTGLDPEVTDAKNPGIDKNTYPRPRNYVVGLSLNF
ncbi:MAG: TonB-dependent receptor [Cytophagales bacterium]|nr:TonB-dependent receptor [Cytophagales bacterium]